MWDTRSWPSEVICLCDYNLFEVVCPFGIPAHDLLRSFVCAGYQLMTFWGRLSVQDIGLWPFWGRLSFWNTSSWPSEVICLCGISDYNLFEVVCPCGITAYDLLRSFVCVITTFLRLFVLLEYQLMTFVSVRDTRSWPSEVVCLCGLPAHDLLRSFVCAGYRITTFFEVVCPCGIPRLWPCEVICLCGISDYDLFKVVCPCGIPAYDLLRSFVCAGNTSLWPFEVICLWITTFLRSSVLVE
jgi:hypothetical protein